jgi:L-rhamnonate dehydratase
LKITSVTAVYPRYARIPKSWRTTLWQIVVRVETDTGITGYGYGGGGLAAVEVVNGHFAELLNGRSLDATGDITSIWDVLYEASIPYGRKGVAIMALSGVDLALWDALGKAERKPVAELLGGVRKERVRAYATGADTDWYAELGFTAHKMPHRWNGSPVDYDSAVNAAKHAREMFGSDAEIMFDVYMSWDHATTIEMAKRLSEYRLHWFEDVLTPDDLEANASLRPLVKPTLIAGGEHEFTHVGFSDVARTGAYDVWQPDITWCGGITAGLRIVEMGRQAGVQVVPHRGGEVWGLHLIAATECEDFGEVLPGMRGVARDEVWLGEPVASDGYLSINDEPGFGVQPNPELM